MVQMMLETKKQTGKYIQIVTIVGLILCSILVLYFRLIPHDAPKEIAELNAERLLTSTGSVNPLLHRFHRPFHMPEKGGGYELFQPIYDMEVAKLGPILFSPTKQFLASFEERIKWVQSIVPRDISTKRDMSIEDRTREMYLEFMKSMLTATVYNDAELSVAPGVYHFAKNFNPGLRGAGRDWTYLGDTMTGSARIKNLGDLLVDVVKRKIPGDYIETGVWRGGSSVFARAVLASMDEQHKRRSYVCDSFAGLPPGDKHLHPGDTNFYSMSGYLGVSAEIVAANFHKFGLLDPGVIFAKGYFNETMPVIKKRVVNNFAIMRLDGDMYESTVDVLYNLYDKLSIGGYVIMDDWDGFPSKMACLDFFLVHGFQPEIIPIDALSVYWKKTEDIDIQYWRYERNDFKL